MSFAVAVMVVLFPALHLGSFHDVVRWTKVAPFFTGVLLTSNIALRYAPMAMIVVFRVLLPLWWWRAVCPSPRIACAQLLPVAIMVGGSILHASGAHTEHLLDGRGWPGLF